jgi:sterol desaturase/sphingolipid hydroxylase (fatty acid hydroxylase superfamily)
MFWDHLLGTYNAPENVPEFNVGLHGYEDEETVADMLSDPFTSKQQA